MVDQPKISDWLSILLLGIVWGGTFMVVTVALEGYGPITVACARTTLGAVSLLILVALTGRKFPQTTPGLWRSVFWIGMLSTAVPFLLLSWGQQHVPSAFAGISMASVPLFVLILAHFFSDEPLIFRRVIGVCLGFVGALVLIGPGLITLGQSAVPLAQLACISAALCYSISSIQTRQCPPIDPITLSALTLLVGAIVLIPLMLIVEGIPSWHSNRSGGAIIFLGLLPTAAATLLRVRVIRSAGSVFMTLVNYQVPIVSMLFGALLLSEDLPLRFFVALVLILSGLATSQWFSLKRMLGF